MKRARSIRDSAVPGSRFLPAEWGPGLAALLLFLLPGPGCGPSSQGLTGSRWETVDLKIKGKTVAAMIAGDDSSRQLGLMYRKSEDLGESQGMLFIFHESEPRSFWMKNTLIPLSIAFIDDSGKILEIADMKPHDEAHTRSINSVRYALEVNQGWFQRNGIAVGDAIEGFASLVSKYPAR